MMIQSVCTNTRCICEHYNHAFNQACLFSGMRLIRHALWHKSLSPCFSASKPHSKDRPRAGILSSLAPHDETASDSCKPLAPAHENVMQKTRTEISGGVFLLLKSQEIMLM
jgi:hypothetical protein